jgi:hypothetical protein
MAQKLLGHLSPLRNMAGKPLLPRALESSSKQEGLVVWVRSFEPCPLLRKFLREALAPVPDALEARSRRELTQFRKATETAPGVRRAPRQRSWTANPFARPIKKGDRRAMTRARRSKGRKRHILTDTDGRLLAIESTGLTFGTGSKPGTS